MSWKLSKEKSDFERFQAKVSIFDKNFDLWQIFQLLTKISIFDKKIVDLNFGFIKKISVFGGYFIF